LGNQVDRPEPDRQWKMGVVQDGSCCDRALTMALFADIFPASMKLAAAHLSTLRTDKSIQPTLLKQICLTGFLYLEPLPKLFETFPFLLTYFRRHLPAGAAILSLLWFLYPILFLGLVDLSR